MSESIKKSDIITGDPFGEIAKQINEALGYLTKFDNEVKQTAKSLGTINTASKKTVQGIDSINKAEKESAKLVQDKIRNDKALEKMRLEEIRINKAREKSIDDYNKKAEREAKVAKDSANAYKQLERATRDQKNESKRLGAELLKLEANGGKNTKEFKKLEQQYRATTAAAQKGDAQLKRLDRTVGDNFRNVGNYERGVRGLRTAFGALGVAFGASQIVGFLKESTELARIQEKAVAQVAAGLASTGGVAGYTLDELKAKASEFQGQTLFGDEQILTELTSVMLTFTNVTGKAFDGAQQAALDLSTRMGGDLKGAAVQLGKALNDPIKGVTALRKVGVSFTQEQMEQIKVLQESGDLMGAQTIILNEMNKEFAGSAKAAADADGGITQLSNAWGDAKEMLGALILEGLKPAITGLKDFFTNLKPEDVRRYVGYIGSLFTVLKRLAQGYVLLKVAQLAFMSDTGKLNFSLTQLKTNLAGSTSGLGKMAGSLKSIGFAAAIGLAFELARTFYDIASGADAARDAAARLETQLSKSNAAAAARISERTEAVSLQIAELQRQRNENKITETEFLAQKKALTDATKDEVKTDIQKVNARKQGFKDQLAELQALQKQYEKTGDAEVFVKLTKKADEVGKQLKITGDKAYGFIESNASASEVVAQLTANIQGSNARLKEYYKELTGVGEISKDLNSELEIEDKNLTKTTAHTKDKTKAVEDLKNTVEDSHLTLEQMHEAELKRLEDEKAALDAVKELSRELDEQLAGDSTIVDIDPEVFTEKELRSLGVMTDAYKEQLKIAQQFQAALTQIATDEIDKRIELSKKEQDAAKSQQDYLEELAANGNITAQQSIAESIEIQREAQAEQIRLEKQKQNVELISAGLQSFNSSLQSGKTPASALAETLVSTNVLVGLLKNLNFYEKGTDNAPGGLAVVDEKGAEIITDKHGNIKEVGAGKGPRFTMLDKGDKVYNATKSAAVFDAIANADKMRPMDSAGNSFDLMQLNGSLLNIEKAIKNQPTSSTEWGGILAGVGKVIETKTVGRSRIRNTFEL